MIELKILIIGLVFGLLQTSLADPRCTSVELSDRSQCGVAGTSRAECLHRGCCYDAAGSSSVWCYFPQVNNITDLCVIPTGYRFDCNIQDEKNCRRQSCCWDPKPNQPSCYRAQSNSWYYAVTKPNARIINAFSYVTQRQWISFSVKSCGNAAVYLSTAPNSLTSSAYLITLGVDKNTKKVSLSRVRNGETAVVQTKNSASGITSCGVDNPVFVSWFDSVIKVGRNTKDLIINYNDPNPSTVNVIIFKSNDEREAATWHADKRAASLVTYNMQGLGSDFNYDTLWFEKRPFQRELVFRVKSPGGIVISLSQFEKDTSRKCYLIKMQHGMTSSIIDTDDSSVENGIETPGLLSPREYRYFWISWSSDEIRWGKGSVVDIATLMFYKPFSQTLNDIRYIGMTGSARLIGSDGLHAFEIPSFEDDTYVFQTFPAAAFPSLKDRRSIYITPSTNRISFSVETCSNAIIRLTTSRGVKHSIILGAQYNNVTQIIYDKGNDETIIEEEKTPYILSCDSMRNFWIRWTYYNLEVGRDTVVSDYIISLDANFTRVHTVEFDTPSTIGKWIINYNKVTAVRLFTPNDNMYSRIWMSAMRRPGLIFQVSACKEAKISLSKYLGISSTSSYELIIGGNNNKEVSLVEYPSKKTLATTPGDYLSCDLSGAFWISWLFGYISFGSGRIPGTNSILAVNITGEPYEINAFGFSLGESNGKPALWSIDPSIDLPKFEVTTPPSPVHKTVYFMVPKEYMTFSVMAAGDARVLLMSVPGNSEYNHYEIRIGEGRDNLTSIYKDGRRVKYGSRSGILDLDNYVDFWVSWSSETIACGTGRTVDLNEAIVSYKNDIGVHYDTRAVSFTCANNEASWKVPQTDAIGVKYFTNPNPLAVQVLAIDTFILPFLTFKVKARSDFHLYLIESGSDIVNFDYVDICIGGSDGKTYIKYIESTPLNPRNETREIANLLSENEFRYFWITWLFGSIRVGTGTQVGSNEIISSFDIFLPYIKSISPLTTNGVEGEFEAFVWFGEILPYIYNTNGGYQYDTFHLVPVTKLAAFSVRACEQVSVAFFSDSTYNYKSYELVIGYSAESFIYMLRNNTPTTMIHSISGLLDCQNFRGFEIDWFENIFHIRLADGTDLEYADDDPLPVYALSFTSRDNVAEFRLPSRLDNEMQFISLGSESSDATLWKTVHQQTQFSFKIKACDNARLFLSEYQGVTTKSATILVINKDSLKLMFTDDTTVNSQLVKDALDCLKYKSYWISWDAGTIKVGSGLIPSVKPFKVLSLPIKNAINAIKYDSLDESQCSWEIDHSRGNVYRFWTPETSNILSWNKITIIPYITFLTFTTDASEWVALSVTAEPGVTDKNAVEIHIGQVLQGKQRTYIVDKNTKEEFVSSGNVNVLVSGRKSVFWISWQAGFVMVGEGSVYNSGRLLVTFTPDYRLNFIPSAVQFATPKQQSNWVIPSAYVKYISYLSNPVNDNVRNYNRLELSSTHISSLPLFFKARGYSDARVTFMQRHGQLDKDSFTVDFGNNNNTATTLLLDNNKYAEQSTINVLNPSKKETFWVDWADSNILSVGKGPNSTFGGLLSTEKDFNVDVKSFAFYTRGSNPVLYDLVNLRGNVLHLYTLDLYDYKTLSLKPSSLEGGFNFRVRTCRDVHILLSRKQFSTTAEDSYEVVIGASNNQAVFIRKGSLTGPKINYIYPSLVNCFEMRDFWVSYKNGTVSVGTGVFAFDPLSELASWKDPSPIDGISYLAFSSYTGSDADWEFSKDYPNIGDAFFYTSGVSLDLVTAWETVQGQDSIHFTVEACSLAVISLSLVPSRVLFSTIDIQLGTKGTKGISIYQRKNNERTLLSSRESTKALLNCKTANSFWISWYDKTVRVGTGSKIGNEEILNHVLSNPIDINGVGYATINSTGVYGIKANFNPDGNRSGSNLSGGQIFGIIVLTLLLVSIAVFAIVLIVLPNARRKASGVLMTFRYNRFTSGDVSSGIDTKQYIDPK